MIPQVTPISAVSPATQIIAAALDCVRRGWFVFPVHAVDDQGICDCYDTKGCKSPGKHPWTKNGLNDAVCDASAVRNWWGKMWPRANVGIATGARSGFVVLDIDPRHGGSESLAELEREHGSLPATVEALTGGGGRHLYFLHPGVQVKNRQGLNAIRPGVDLKGDGGYVIAPPSVHESGRSYEWELSSHPDDVAIAPMPAWLLNLAVEDGHGNNGKGLAPAVAESILEGARDNTLMSIAGTLRRRGAEYDEILAFLEVFNRNRCRPPLSDQEVQHAARSVCRYAPNEQPAFEMPGSNGHGPASVWQPPEEAEKAEEAAAEQKAAARRSAPIEWLRSQEVFKRVPIAGARKLGREWGQYELLLDGGTVVKLGTAENVLTPRKVQAAIADAVAVAIPLSDEVRKEWRAIAEAIMVAAGPGEDIGSDPETEARAWLTALTAGYPFDPARAVDTGDAKALAAYLQRVNHSRVGPPSYGDGWFWSAAHELYVHVPTLVRFIGGPFYGGRTSRSDVCLRLRRLGFEQAQPTARDEEGRVCKARMWISPRGFDPGE